MMDAGPVEPRDRPLVEQRLRDTAEEADLVAAFFPLADGFRLWLDRRLADRPRRRLAARLERLAATVSAGWPAPGPLRRMDDIVASIGTDPGLSEADRRAFAEGVRPLAAIERTLIVEPALRADGVVVGRVVTARVEPATIRSWLDALGISAPADAEGEGEGG